MAKTSLTQTRHRTFIFTGLGRIISKLRKAGSAVVFWGVPFRGTITVLWPGFAIHTISNIKICPNFRFNDILVIMLIGACIVSLSLGQYAAGTTIVIIVMFNAILGAIQRGRDDKRHWDGDRGMCLEHGAGAAMDALAALQSSTASVIRDGNLQKIDGSLAPTDM
eukprot:1334561-Amorphochlora_amoeboformis.AAC.4